MDTPLLRTKAEEYERVEGDVNPGIAVLISGAVAAFVLAPFRAHSALNVIADVFEGFTAIGFVVGLLVWHQTRRAIASAEEVVDAVQLRRPTWRPLVASDVVLIVWGLAVDALGLVGGLMLGLALVLTIQRALVRRWEREHEALLVVRPRRWWTRRAKAFGYVRGRDLIT